MPEINHNPNEEPLGRIVKVNKAKDGGLVVIYKLTPKGKEWMEVAAQVGGEPDAAVGALVKDGFKEHQTAFAPQTKKYPKGVTPRNSKAVKKR